MSKSLDSNSKRFVAIDANSLVHRAFHAFPSTLSTTDGTQVNAVYGFTSMLLRVLEELDPKYLVCAFDLKEPTFRHTEYADYKATRKPTDHTLIDQFPLVKDVLKAFNVPVLEKKGFEADDILGTLAAYVGSGKWNGELEMVVVTGDTDLLQIVEDNVTVWLPHGGFKNMRMYDRDEVEKRYGFGPEFIPDFKGLVGDPSDNIPGVKGIGKKTATDLIRAFGHLEGMYENIDELAARPQKLLREGEEPAEMSRNLAQIRTDVDIEVQLEDCLMRDFNRKDVMEVFQRFEFRSLMNKIPESVHEDDGVQIGLFGGNTDEDGPGDTVDDVGSAEDLRGELSDGPAESSIVYIPAEGYAVAVVDGGSEATFFQNLGKRGEGIQVVIDVIRKSGSVVMYGWEDFCRDLYENGRGRVEILELFRESSEKVIDVALAAYHLSSGQRDYSLKNLAFTYAGIMLPEEVVLTRSRAKKYIEILRSVMDSLDEELGKRSLTIGKTVLMDGRPLEFSVWRNVDVPMSMPIAAMSKAGVRMDADKLRKKEKELKKEIDQVEQRIFESIGHEFNVNSSRQLADVLFEELDLPVQKRRKTGPSTDESVLRKLWGMHPSIEDILLYREKVKMANTYVGPLLEYLAASNDGRVHSVFKQTGTTTGRLSSMDPNLQNIPVRSPLGREIRDMFIAEEGKVLLAIDYSQIDLRVMAHFSQDELMLNDLKGGADFHRATAARVLNKKEEYVTKKDRRIAKTINFGILYGLSAFGLSETLDIEREEASKYIDRYFEKYMGVKEYLEKAIDEAHSRGYVETALGRRRYISGLDSNNRVRRSAAEREAINLPIQGTAADIMRVAMNEVYEYTLERGEDVRLVLQIHDEFLFECPEKVVKKAGQEVKNIMESAMELSVPLIANLEYGSSLANMKSL